MSFNCLWYCNSKEYDAWHLFRKATHSPFITHRHANAIDSQKTDSSTPTGLCLWSTSYLLSHADQVPKTSNRTPHILLAKEKEEAVLAFRKNFNHCICLTKTIEENKIVLVDSLSAYFHPKNKVAFLKKKLYLLSEDKYFSAAIIDWDRIVAFYQKSNTIYVYLQEEVHTFRHYDYQWIAIQCKHAPNFYSIRPNYTINLNALQYIDYVEKNHYRCYLDNQLNLQITSHEKNTLLNTIQKRSNHFNFVWNEQHQNKRIFP